MEISARGTGDHAKISGHGSHFGHRCAGHWHVQSAGNPEEKCRLQQSKSAKEKVSSWEKVFAWVSRGLVARWRRLHVTPRIDRRVVHAHFIVHVRSSRTAADAAIANHLAALDSRTRDGRKRRKMRVPGGDPEAMIDHDYASVAGVILGTDHNAVSGHVHRRSIIRSHIHARVERAFTAERIEALAKTVCDMSEHRPNRRRVA